MKKNRRVNFKVDPREFNPHLPTANVKVPCLHCGKTIEIAIQVRASQFGVYLKKYDKKGVPSFVPRRRI